MTQQEKKIYNQLHYQKNRPIILERVKNRYKSQTPKVVPLFSQLDSVKKESRGLERQKEPPERPDRKKWKMPKVKLGTVFLVLLSLADSYFLITEMARYYVSVDSSLGHTSGEAYLKAFLLEGGIVSLCWMVKSKSFFLSLMHHFLIAVIYSYSIWVLSNLAIQGAWIAKDQVALLNKRVATLESEIAKKTTLRDVFFQSDRISLGSKVDSQITVLKQSLDATSVTLTQLPPAGMIWNNLVSVVCFRILVMLSNLITLKELGRRFQKKPNQR